MIAEVALPLGNSRLIFSVFLSKLILNELAEAFVSRADKAIAYDSFAAEGGIKN